MFRADAKTGLPKKKFRKKQQFKKETEAAENKRKTKSLRKRTSGKPNPRQARGVTLKTADNKGNSDFIKQRRMVIHCPRKHGTYPKQQDTEATPSPQPALSAEPTRKSTRNRRAILTLALWNPLPINEINWPRSFSISSPEWQTS